MIEWRKNYDDPGEDYTLPLTPENQTFLTAVAHHWGGEDGAAKLREIEAMSQAADGEAGVSDSWIMRYYGAWFRALA